MDCGDLVIGQLEFYWDFHLWPRLEGLTDEEYFWEPVEGAWSVRPDESGRMVVDHTEPVPDPPPVTTIAWRLVHVAVNYATRVNTFFGDGSVPDDADMFDPRHVPADLPGTAADGLAFLEHWYTRWRQALRGLTEDELARPLGPKGAYYADDSMLALAVHVNRESIHHGAEICLLRDLYRAGVAGDQRARV
ncbi:DinB family protein [Kribbella sp. CA-247076]|uniref:DinB family protein n=1 Tax=Kribbella sp. CA-247076 TaxID=3239941 RepID=UPI003D8BC1BA